MTVPMIALGEITSQVAEQQGTLWNLNPTVWGAVLQTTRYAGLFRLVKSKDATGWGSFVTQVSRLQVSPVVQTPTQWEKTATHQ